MLPPVSEPSVRSNQGYEAVLRGQSRTGTLFKVDLANLPQMLVQLTTRTRLDTRLLLD